MAGFLSANGFRFLFRQDRGTIDRSTWRSGACVLLAVWCLFILAEWLANRTGNLAKVGVTGLFVLATMLVAVCYYFLSAKRFTDRGRPKELALVLPAFGLADAALNFMQPREGGTFPLWLTSVADAVLVGIVIWNAVELGFLPARGAARD
jgi:uncharacterized membrane protein YhaH (DUF805 family)